MQLGRGPELVVDAVSLADTHDLRGGVRQLGALGRHILARRRLRDPFRRVEIIIAFVAGVDACGQTDRLSGRPTVTSMVESMDEEVDLPIAGLVLDTPLRQVLAFIKLVLIRGA